MRGWLSRQGDGKYMITALKPVVKRIGKTERECVYARPGDPVILRHCCEDMIQHLFNGIEIERLSSVRVEISGHALSGGVL